MISSVFPGATLMSTLFAGLFASSAMLVGMDPAVAQAPPMMELPGRPPVDPLEFPTDTPSAPVETPVLQEEDITESANVSEAEEAANPAPENASENASDTEETEVVSEARAESVAVPWRKFTNEAGQFRVAMPSQPARYSLGTSPGIEDSQMYMQLQLVDGAYLEIYAAAFVASTAFLQSQQSQPDPEAALLQCVTSLGDLPERSEPQYLSASSEQIGERGVEMTFRGESGAFQVSRCYLVGDRAYMLTVSRERFDAGAGLIPLNDTAPQTGEVRSAGMDVFFDSFEVLN